MTLIEWIIAYAINNTLWLWIIYLGWARILEWSFLSWFLIDYLAVNWSEDAIRLYAWLLLIGSTIWFLIGVFQPGLRL